jgi:hypothetical protein
VSQLLIDVDAVLGLRRDATTLTFAQISMRGVSRGGLGSRGPPGPGNTSWCRGIGKDACQPAVTVARSLFSTRAPSRTLVAPILQASPAIDPSSASLQDSSQLPPSIAAPDRG